MKNLCMFVSVCAFAFAVTAARAGDAKTFKPDDEGFIRNWLVLEAIQLDDKAANHDEDNQKDFFNKEFFKDLKKCAPKDGDKVKVDTKDLAWKATQFDDAVCAFAEQDNTMNIAVTYVTCEADIPDVKLKIGSDDSSIWLLNGKEIIRVFAGRGVEKDQDTSGAVKLNKGVNVLMGQVINGGGPTGMCARFVDKDDKPVKNITIGLTPPAAP
ncbi:MAG: hypothetical protein NTW87_10315 [Planctomycetota bacterium]|nr:hypothetical protein [Planctomycetota bacterium]